MRRIGLIGLNGALLVAGGGLLGCFSLDAFAELHADVAAYSRIWASFLQ